VQQKGRELGLAIMANAPGLEIGDPGRSGEDWGTHTRPQYIKGEERERECTVHGGCGDSLSVLTIV